jgi:hypothetical protein
MNLHDSLDVRRSKTQAVKGAPAPPAAGARDRRWLTEGVWAGQ